MKTEIKTFVTGRDYGTPQVLYYTYLDGVTLMVDPSRDIAYTFEGILDQHNLLMEYDYNGSITGYETQLAVFEAAVKAAIQ